MRRIGIDRHGLAMLELTIALPLLLFIMALMINYGSVACWKVRTLMMANYTMSRERFPRDAVGLPSFQGYWPSPGGTYASGRWTAPAADVTQVNQPIVRGPQFDLNLGPSQLLLVNPSLFDSTLGFREGRADLRRMFAMVARLGAYHLQAHHAVLENLWQYPRTYLGTNVQRRLPVLYTLIRAPASFSSAYVAAIWAILNAPWLADMYPLELDMPDFPGLPAMCTTDRQVVDRNVQLYLLDRDYPRSIPRVPERLETLFPPDSNTAVPQRATP